LWDDGEDCEEAGGRSWDRLNGVLFNFLVASGEVKGEEEGEEAKYIVGGEEGSKEEAQTDFWTWQEDLRVEILAAPESVTLALALAV